MNETFENDDIQDQLNDAIQQNADELTDEDITMLMTYAQQHELDFDELMNDVLLFGCQER